MATEPPVLEAPASHWPDEVMEATNDRAGAPEAEPPTDRRLLWGALGLTGIGLLAIGVAIARKAGFGQRF